MTHHKDKHHHDHHHSSDDHHHHHSSDDHENWLSDYSDENDYDYYDPYGLVDYSYDHIYHDYDFHIEQDPHDEEMFHISYPAPTRLVEEHHEPHKRRHQARNGIEDLVPMNYFRFSKALEDEPVNTVNETPIYTRTHLSDPVYLEPDYHIPEAMTNETPIYTRSHLSDPVFLEPDYHVPEAMSEHDYRHHHY